MSKGRYVVNEIFLSLQGEGMRAGTLNVFVRLAHCNLRCAVEAGPRSPGGFDCDTEFESGVEMTADQVAARCRDLWPSPGVEQWVVLTGGEPLLQADAELFAALGRAGFKVAVETNGSIEVPQLPATGRVDGAMIKRDLPLALQHYWPAWITVSPKVAEHAVRQPVAHEVKYVRGAGQAIPRPTCRGLHKLLSPAHDGLDLDRQALATCVELVKAHPDWRLSVQMHKQWRVR